MNNNLLITILTLFIVRNHNSLTHDATPTVTRIVKSTVNQHNNLNPKISQKPNAETPPPPCYRFHGKYLLDQTHSEELLVPSGDQGSQFIHRKAQLNPGVTCADI